MHKELASKITRVICLASVVILIGLASGCEAVLNDYEGPPRPLSEVAVIYNDSETIRIQDVDGHQTYADIGTGWADVREIRLPPGTHTVTARLIIGTLVKTSDFKIDCAAGKKYRLKNVGSGYVVTIGLVETDNQ